jgi:DNA-binding transcriptional LysR family regulator
VHGAGARVQLRVKLGANLLQRSTRKLSMTEDGAAFLTRAARIVRDVQEPRPTWPSGAGS